MSLYLHVHDYFDLTTDAGFQDDSGQFSSGVAASGANAGSSLTQTLYVQESGDASAVSVNDLHQGQLGDCFLISSIGEIAINAPSAINNMIHVNANGSETVTLYTAASGHLPTFGTTAFRADAVTVTNTFSSASVNNGATQDVVGNLKEIWPQVIEKAVATLDGGYSAIASGGNPVIAMEELTGQAASYMSPASLTLAGLKAMMAAGDLITMDTANKSNLPYNLVGDHAYMMEKLTMSGGVAMVQLGNPWGIDQPTAIPLSQLSKGVAEVDVGHLR